MLFDEGDGGELDFYIRTFFKNNHSRFKYKVFL